jgi:hypothetical protein
MPKILENLPPVDTRPKIMYFCETVKIDDFPESRDIGRHSKKLRI